MLNPLNLGFVGPVSALIDNNNILTVNWLPPASPLVTGWEIFLNGNPTASVLAPSTFYTTILPAGPWTMNMRTNVAGSPPVLYDWEWYSPTLTAWQPVTSLTPPNLAFPDAIPSADVTFSSTTLELGQPLTVTLQPAYTGADQWQVIWPDDTSTGWLPLSASLLIKQFSISGPLNVVIQTRKLYTSSIYSPPVTLMRQLAVQIFVVDQQYTGTTITSTFLTGTLGIGGQQGFEITGATGVAGVANPWEVIARFLVRDTVTNEIKLGIATTRFSNASSLLGTMGIDVFPIEGRPKEKELIVPVYENSFNALASSVPVNITTTQLPATIYVGKPMAEFQMGASGGNIPYAWYTDGLPAGLKLSVNGVLSGTPLALGTNSINFAVQDASVPFYIAEQSFPIMVSTDLLVELALNQQDANSNILPQLGTSLGVAQVDMPYSVQMQVGNINPSNPSPGGLPPYTWSIPAGNLPIGLSINPNTGLLSGIPTTYNSTTDFNKTFSGVVQVTDAVGAIATQTYTMTLEPAVLQFGNLSQPIIYAGQQFKLMVPIFGGISPYTFNYLTQFFVSPADSAYYDTPVLVDGQIEVGVNFPDTALGTHTFSLQITDHLGHMPSGLPTQFTLTVEAALSDPFFVPAFVDHVWGYADVSKSTPIAITGDLAGFTIGGGYASLQSAANAVSGNTTYTGTAGFCSGGGGNAYVGLTFVVSGFQNPLNNGVFACTTSSSSLLTLNNPNGVAENDFPVRLALTSVDASVPGYLTNPAAPFAITTKYHGTITDGANNALVGQSFNITGFANAGNNGLFNCVGSTLTTLTLSNAGGVHESLASTTYNLTSAIRAAAASSVATELASAASYAILASSAITNTGSSVIEGGNVGSYPTNSITPGAWTLTPPAVVVTATAQNQTDLATAISHYGGLSATYTLTTADLGTQTFGGSPVGTYYAGVYKSPSSIAIDTPIILDAQGDPNALFVFYATASTITQQIAGTMTLINGAQAGNVVWVCGSSWTSIGPGAVTVGNVLAHTSITLGGGSLDGRALANTGAVTISTAETITVPATSSALTTIYTGSFPASPPLSGIFIVTGFDIVGNNGIFAIVSNSSTQLILANPNGSMAIDYSTGSPPIAAATQLAIAIQSEAKALQATVLSNGIAVAIDPVIPEVEFSGPASGVYGNTQDQIPILLQLSGNTVATVSQAYTILTHDDAASIGWAQGTDIGTISTVTRPYIVGEVVGLNPRQPYYNSPNVLAVTPSPAPSDAPWFATVQSGSLLPPGISLDANTGLVYGTLMGVFTGTSVIQYIGASGVIHGTVTVTWVTYQSDFQLADNIIDSVLLGTSYPATSYIAVPSAITPQSASIVYGRLPAGLVLSSSPTGQNFMITGSATESGYFDVWFRVVGSTGIAYLYHRFSIDFVAPLTIVNTSLPNISQQAYSVQMQGFGGTPPYTWSAVFPAGVTGLSISSSSGLITGTLGAFPGSSPTDLGNVAVTLTDSLLSAITAQLDLTYNNSLRITTPLNGIAAIVPSDPEGYSFQMQAAGGVPPYTWVETGALPTGIAFDNSTGVLSGTYTGAIVSPSTVSISVTDTAPTTVTVTNFIITTMPLSSLVTINNSGVGDVPRGEAYQGTLSAVCMTPPIQWQVAPTTAYPNILPSGLALQVNGTGATATIAGVYSGAVLTGYPVRIIAVDSLGDTAEAIVPLTTNTNLVIIGWDYAGAGQQIGVQPFPLPNAVITATYGGSGGIQLVAIHGVPSGVLANGYNQYSWGVSPPLPSGLSLSGTGVISGTASTLFSTSITFTVSDSLSPANTATYTTPFASQTSALTITTASLPNATAGTPYSFQMAETGAVGSYSWSITSGSLPSGLSMSSAGLITGTTVQVLGHPIRFRVTDSTGAYYTRFLTLTVVSNLTLYSGIGYEDSLGNASAFSFLGYVDTGNVVSISPRANLSFYVVAKNVVSTSPSQLTVTVSGGFTGTVVSLTGPPGSAIAQIQLTGPFSAGSSGANNLTISVTDSGVTATHTFTWWVYSDGTLRLSADNAFPTKLTTPS